MHPKRLLVLILLPFAIGGCVSFPEFAATPEQPSATRAGTKPFHRVQRGDTLWAIAFENNQTVDKLVAWNGIRDRNTIYVGQVLRLTPPPGGTPTARNAVRTAQPKALRASAKPVVVARPPPPKPKPVVLAPPPATAPRNTAPAPPPPPNRPATAPVKKSPKRGVAAASASGYAVRSRDGVRWQWPVNGPILKRYSAAAEGKKGVQIGGREGQSIQAAANGKIVYSGSGLRGYGQLIIIEHDKNYLSAYAHNRVLLVTEGEEVVMGQSIAEMGKTGASRVMLHFEIRRDGQAVDPALYLPPHAL